MNGIVNNLIHKIKKKTNRLLLLNEKDFLIEVQSTARRIGRIKITGPCYVNDKTEIGSNTVINGIRVIGSGACTIGSYCHIAYGATVITMNHNYKGNGIPYDDTDIEKPVKIKDFVWIGANVTILPGVTIGEGAIIQAGSVVRKSIPSLALAGGNPAEVFKYRDEEHYKKMKLERRFF